ncbi:MAG: hypothetical protein Sapg2KO_45700 [Saprospiraceae bacterium]
MPHTNLFTNKTKSVELHIQKCQACESTKLKNILYRQTGRADKVYVQCQDCGAFVASYAIAPRGYYHHGKGYESFIRGISRGGEYMSGSRIKRLFIEHKEREIQTFEKVLELLKERDKKKQQ